MRRQCFIYSFFIICSLVAMVFTNNASAQVLDYEVIQPKLPKKKYKRSRSSSKQQKRNSKSARMNALRRGTNSNTVRIVVGGESDTQIRIAQDLKNVLNEQETSNRMALRIIPLMGEGGKQNVLDVMFLHGVDLAIVQTDILAHLRGENWSMYNDIFERVHYIAKLYNAEWHVIGSRKITNIRQLNGKTINIAKPGSGTHITSSNILELLGVRVKYTHYAHTVALEKLRKGELDAIAWIGGAPIDTIRTIRSDEGLHFIPVTFFNDDYFKTPLKNVLETFYLPTLLQHEQYPNLIKKGETVPTAANGVVLAVFNWSLSRNEKRKLKVRNFIERLVGKFDKFMESGRHPKWREINLASTIPEWKRSDLAKDLIGQGAEKNAVGVSYKVFLKMLELKSDADPKELSEDEKMKQYQSFLKYLQSR
ncbi:MAG: TAXI family TRAP transporter solute-binding subunit [Methyloligellaceae bacterium]